MATYINNNVKFHAFSKSPVSPDTTLGGAVNPSGHTITTSQVRSQDIPAFLNTFQGDKTAALTWLSTNYATPAHNDIVFYGGEFKAGFSTPKCLKYNAKAETPAWEDFDITKATTLKNADDKDVIAVHQDCTTVFVDGGNNAATNSNRWSLFVKKSDGSILDHFVASTDKIVAGMPSLGYNALVMWKGAAIDEGELDANYVGNTFAGIIHLNKQYATGDDTNNFTVTCFEYIGDKLDSTLGNIREEIQDIVGVTMEGVVASVTANDAATSAGIGVDSTSKTSPKITFTAGSVTTGETKLVSGGAVKTYVDTTALTPETGSIAKAIASAVEDAKVTINGSSSKNFTIKSSSVAKTENTEADIVSIVVDPVSTGANGESVIGIKATVNTATWNESEQKFDDEDALLVAGVAQTVINNTIINQITEVVGPVPEGETPTIGTAIKKGIEDATLTSGDNAIASATGDAETKLVTAEQVKEYVDENAKVTLTAGTGISIPTGGTPGTSFEVSIASDYLVKASDVTAISDRVTTLETVTVPALEGTISGVSQTVADIQTSLSTGAIHSEIAAAKSAADAAMEEAGKKVASVTGPTTGLVTVKGDKEVTIEVSDTIATKTDAANAASTAITTSLAGTTDGTIGGAISSAVSGLKTELTTGEGSLGGKVTALENSVKTINETTIPNAITTAQNGAVTTVKALTLSASDTDDAAKVTVTLGGTVETPTLTVTTSDIASAQSLTALETKVNNFHKAGVSYVVADTLPTIASGTEATYNGKVYLVNTGLNGVVAADGSRIEYMYVNKGSEESPAWDWEQIGTTKTDLSGYATNATIEAMDADLTVNGISVKQVDGTITELSESLITASVPAGTTSVEGNVAYVGSTKHVIAPEKFQTAAQMPATLTSWVADLSNLTVGDNMFKGTALTTFIGDLDSLTSGVDMFNGCTLDDESWEIIADTLPTVEGEHIIHMGIYTVDTWSSLKSDCLEVIEDKGWSCQHEMGGEF